MGQTSGDSSKLTARETDASRGRSEGARNDTSPSKSTRRTKFPDDVKDAQDQDQASKKSASVTALRQRTLRHRRKTLGTRWTATNVVQTGAEPPDTPEGTRE